jgi:hypothetical protein
LNLIRKFSRQLLKSLAFLTRQDVDIVHCDLKPENIVSLLLLLFYTQTNLLLLLRSC